MTSILERPVETEEPLEEAPDLCEVGGFVRVGSIFGFRFMQEKRIPCGRPAGYIAMFPCGDTMLMCEHHHDQCHRERQVIVCDHGDDFWPAQMTWVKI